MQNASTRQKDLYEGIHDAYQAHYFDPSSMEYRNLFVYKPMFKGLDLNNKTVADLACSGGDNSIALLKRFPNAHVVGFDISSKACETYRANVGKEAYELDLTLGVDPELKVDVAMICGGIHHCIADLKGTFKTITNLLKPNGLLLMCEPNRHCFLEIARKIWYQHDKFFDAQTEAALSHDEILRIASPKFMPLDCKYMGGPAYFLIYNSLVLRVPLGIKPFLAPPLFFFEKMYNLIPGKFAYPYFVARWQKC